MTEHDAFEVRFHAAIRGYVGSISSGLDPVALAGRIVATEPRRHGFAETFTLRTFAAPRRSWVLLLLTTLLLAVVAGMLVVGSPERILPVVVPPIGPAAACPPGSNPDAPGPIGQARPVIGDGHAATVFDRHAGRIVLLGQLESGTQTWTLDVCSNTWTRMNPAREPTVAEAAHLIYDVDSDATIAVDGQGTWVYDLAANTWTRKSVTPVIRQWGSMTWTYDPVSGLVIAADASELWGYDVETDTWAFLSSAPWQAGRAAIAYDASVDRIVAYSREDAPPSFELRLFDLRSRAWSTSLAATPGVFCGMGWPNPWIAYDEAAELTVVSCNSSVAYDASADRWELLVGWEPLIGDGGSFSSSVYDATNKRFLGLGENRDGVLAFDLVTRERIVLLEPSAGQVSPGSS